MPLPVTRVTAKLFERNLGGLQAALEEGIFVGKIDFISISHDRASLQMSLESKNKDKVSITLYEDDGKSILKPQDGMWRGVLLSVAQRALTHRHRIAVWTEPGLTKNKHIAESIVMMSIDD